MTGRDEQLRRSWEANAAAWCSAVREDQIESRRTVTNAAIIAAVLEGDPKTVLDLGCGEGWLARELAARGIDVTGIDASAPLIEAARELGGGAFVVLSYAEIIAGRLPFRSPFDLIVANFSLLDDRVEELLRALRPALYPEGRLLIQTVNPSSIGGAADGWRTETFAAFPGEWPEAMPWYFRTKQSWTQLLDRAGYRRIVVRETPASLLIGASLNDE